MSVLGTFLNKRNFRLYFRLINLNKVITKQKEQDVRKEYLEQEHSLRNCIKTFGHRV